MGSQTFCASGCFTVPSGVTKLKVQAWGGGGGGAQGYYNDCCATEGGSGGGGGGYGEGCCVPVTAGGTYRVTVGAGGAGGTAATCGGCSCFTGNCSRQVGGGGGKHGHPYYVSPCGGLGGAGFGNAASTKNTGTKGGNGLASGAAGHGGKGACPCGGAGGSGAAGTAPGGGGSGGTGYYGYDQPGFGGAHGRVTLTWKLLTVTATATPTTGTRPLCVDFCATPCSGCPPYRYDWNFGSCGGTSASKAPVHEYAMKGTYCPTVQVKDVACHTACAAAPQIKVKAPSSSRTFTASGCFTVPKCITELTIQAYGGGGAGGCWSACPCFVTVMCGGGGGGGGYGKGAVPVTPLATYHVSVGSTSSFTGNCSKEVGAHPGNTGAPGVGGTGGAGFGSALVCSITGSSGDVSSGGNGAGPCGGVGGGPGYYVGPGCSFPATPGAAPGGGGAGAHYQTYEHIFGPSSGGGGRVVISWCCPCAPCPPICATATACPTHGKKPLTVHFGSSVTGGEPPFTYLWQFKCACSATSTCANPTHTYPKAGTFHPTLDVHCPYCVHADPTVPTITVTSCPSPCCPSKLTGSITNLHIGREPIPRLSNPRRIVTCCDIGGS